MENLPVYIPIIFGVTTVATLLTFVSVISKSDLLAVRGKFTQLLSGLTIWLAIQGVLALNGIFTDSSFIPPKIALLGILPPILTIIALFSTSRGKRFIDSLPLRQFTYLNVVRIPVELVLYWLFLNKAVPDLMTFEGRNFDILAGLSAPFIAYYGFTKQKISRTYLLIWNFACLGLLINIVVIAILSAPSPFQQLALEQPNLAIVRFPYSWLPTFIVPVILFGHLVSIRQLLKGKKIAEVMSLRSNFP